MIDNKTIAENLGVCASKSRTQGDQWRAVAYTKAAALVKAWKTPITSAAQARKIPGIGASIAEKIGELLQTGHLRKAEYKSEEDQAYAVFGEVWGAGPETCKSWYAKGLRTLDDLRRHEQLLTAQQRLGLRYYEEFKQRIPRKEVEQIGRYVTQAAQRVNPQAHVVVCGSFRRGAETCGDVDCLLTLLDDSSGAGFLMSVVAELHRVELITDDLVTLKLGSDKYFGVCRLPRPRKDESGVYSTHLHRRIDFHLVNLTEYPFALLYFTGSAYFNRSVRLWTQRKTPYSLSDHGIRVRTADGSGSKGPFAPGTEGIKTEEHIFQALGIPYIPPHLRD